MGTMKNDKYDKMIPSKKKLRDFLCSRRRQVIVTAMEIFRGIPMEQQTIFIINDAMPMFVMGL